MTKIEEIARSQAEAIFGKGCPLDADDYIRARAAIEAMKEPTPEMKAAASRIPHARDDEIYRAMIDAALSEKE